MTTLPRPLVRSRGGRLLLECLVSMVLLSAAAAAFMAGTKATALLTDDALLVTRAHSLSGAAGERAQYASCAAVSAAAGEDLPRVHVTSTPLRQGLLQGTSVVATMRLSPLATGSAANAPAAELTLSAARACP